MRSQYPRDLLLKHATERKRDDGLPLCSMDYIEPDGIRHLLYRAQVYFKPRVLIVPPRVARDFWLMDFKVGSSSIKFRRDKDKNFVTTQGYVSLTQAGDVPPALDMIFVVTNKSETPRVFYAEIWGEMDVRRGQFD